MLTLKLQLVTEYHVGIATTDWLRALTSHVQWAIERHSVYRTSSGDGVVCSQYNEDRFMGPLSLVKNDFIIRVRVSRGISLHADRYESTIRFKPDSVSFDDLRETIETRETIRRDNRNFNLVAKLCRRISSGCARTVVDDWRCPWCDSPVRLSFHHLGRTFVVSCDNNHFCRHETTVTPPEWWRDAVSDGWLECDAREATEPSDARKSPVGREFES